MLSPPQSPIRYKRDTYYTILKRSPPLSPLKFNLNPRQNEHVILSNSPPLSPLKNENTFSFKQGYNHKYEQVLDTTKYKGLKD